MEPGGFKLWVDWILNLCSPPPPTDAVHGLGGVHVVLADQPVLQHLQHRRQRHPVCVGEVISIAEKVCKVRGTEKRKVEKRWRRGGGER